VFASLGRPDRSEAIVLSLHVSQRDPVWGRRTRRDFSGASGGLFYRQFRDYNLPQNLGNASYSLRTRTQDGTREVLPFIIRLC
ncbi:MAG: hypothetical protein ACPL68_05435, partial [Candidatus Hydrothermia bacterium]